MALRISRKVGDLGVFSISGVVEILGVDEIAQVESKSGESSLQNSENAR